MPHTPTTEQTIFNVHPSAVPLAALIAGISVVGIAIVLVAFPSLQIPDLPLVRPIVVGLIIAIVVLVDFVVVLSYLTTFFSLTSQRVMHRFGIIGTKSDTIELDRIASVEIIQGLLGRIFNYGDIRIEGDHPESIINFRLIGNPKQRYDEIKHEQI